MQYPFSEYSNAALRRSCNLSFSHAFRMINSLTDPSSFISLRELSMAGDDLHKASTYAYKLGDQKNGRTLLLSAYQCYKIGLRIGGAGGSVELNSSKAFSEIKRELGMDSKKEGFVEPDFVIVDTRLLMQLIKIEARILPTVTSRSFNAIVKKSLEKLRRRNKETEE